ncbi:hypothetical protein F2Q69_00015863 [Brassica cretica]|uniref:Uncharacterized protein n=1 Tax=Brassica cretica TaxID=69181 RepID=A0A8S9QVZ0_BRACR|nr:hypothetical protein F2Q69_00015863 [Brassica cretica]
MSRGSVSIDVRGGMSIDVEWVWAVDGRMVSVDGGRRVSFDEQVMLSIDALRLLLRMVCSRSVGSEKRSVCSLLLVLLGMHLKRQEIILSIFADYLSPELGPRLSLVDLEKVSIDSNNGVSINTPFSPSINATRELSIDEPSRERYRTGLTCSLG